MERVPAPIVRYASVLEARRRPMRVEMSPLVASSTKASRLGRSASCTSAQETPGKLTTSTPRTGGSPTCPGDEHPPTTKPERASRGGTVGEEVQICVGALALTQKTKKKKVK